MNKDVCNLFINVDKLFIEGNVKEDAFNSSCTNFCPVGGCNNNYDRIGALCEYLLTELQNFNNKSKESIDNANQNYEFVFMWLADKFLKITHDASFSISDYYEDVIIQSGSNFNCWDKLDSKKYLKGSNLSIMSKFYYIFINICNSLVENDISKFDLNKFKKFDFEHYKNYRTINSEASNCYAYIQLLTDLKKTYDEYRNLAIKQIPNDHQGSVKNITCPEINNKDSQPLLLFQSNGCIKLHEFFGQPRQKPKPKIQPNDSQDKKESPPSNIGEEFDFEKIRDYSVQTFEKYSPLFNHAATSIKHRIHDMVTSNFINMVGISAKYLKAIENYQIIKKKNLKNQKKKK
ncbi:hypothetical protein YYE_02711 [Plasmodium vinckei vinckei]|nr:hypothetical protein YYE_02711 [Plasmodium vinckei vinckei]